MLSRLYSTTRIYLTSSSSTKRDRRRAYRSACNLVTSLSLNCSDMVGVFCFLVAVIRISLNRGMPNVTFFSPCPAKWKVLSVI